MDIVVSLAANAETERVVSGETIIVEAGPVVITTDDGRPPITLNTGQSVKRVEFHRLTIRNPLATTVDASIKVGYGDIRVNRNEVAATVTQVVQPVNIGNTVAVDVQPGGAMVSGSDVTLTVGTPSHQIAANANRKELIILLQAGGGDARIHGLRVPSGGGVGLTVTGAVTVDRIDTDLTFSYTEVQ